MIVSGILKVSSCESAPLISGTTMSKTVGHSRHDVKYLEVRCKTGHPCFSLDNLTITDPCLNDDNTDVVTVYKPKLVGLILL